MYFMLLNEIAQAQSSSTPVEKPQRLETVSGKLNASDPTPADESPAAHLPLRTLSDMRHTNRTVPEEWLATVPSFPPASHQPTPKLTIGQIQSRQESESTLAPDDYQWHNGNRNEDKMTQEYLESLQHQFIQATNAANKLTNRDSRAFIAKNCAIQHRTTAMLDSRWIKNGLQRVGNEPHQASVTQQHRKAVNTISVAYGLIQATPRRNDQHHITLMGNDIRNGAMASDDPMMAPDEHDLVFLTSPNP